MALKKNDFIEIEFTGMVKNGEIFDSNIKEDLKKANLDIEPKPFVFCLGEGMFLNGIEEFLLGKEIGKYEIELSPERAFGSRNPKLIQIIPSKSFKEQKLNPLPGVMFNFDGRLAKVISVSQGRILVDFNNPMAGKTVVYKVNVMRKIDDMNEKAKSLIEFLFKSDLKFEIKDNNITVYSDEKFVKFIELFKDKFKSILGLDLRAKAKENKEKQKEEKKKAMPNGTSR